MEERVNSLPFLGQIDSRRGVCKIVTRRGEAACNFVAQASTSWIAWPSTLVKRRSSPL